jgi:hypothetical protein
MYTALLGAGPGIGASSAASGSLAASSSALTSTKGGGEMYSKLDRTHASASELICT